MATASLVFGMFFCVPLAGFLAIIFGILGLKKTRDSYVRGKGTAIAGILLGCVGVLATAMMMSPQMMAIRLSDRIVSGNNMKLIGLAISAYCNEHRGRYPPDLGALIMAQDVSVDVFVYPPFLKGLWGGTSVPSSVSQMTREQQAQWVNEHSDYVYVGAGLTESADADMVVACEKDGIDSKGTNVLFADGHVDCNPTGYVHQLIEKQKSKSADIAQ